MRRLLILFFFTCSLSIKQFPGNQNHNLWEPQYQNQYLTQEDELTPEELGLFVDFLKLEFPEYIVGEEEMFVLPEDMPEEVFFKKLEDKFMDMIGDQMPEFLVEEVYEEGTEGFPVEEFAEVVYEKLTPEEALELEETLNDLPQAGPHFGPHGGPHGGPGGPHGGHISMATGRGRW